MSKKPANQNASKRMARLAAVQGLYRIALTAHTAQDIIRDFRDHPQDFATEMENGEKLKDVDPELFGAIVTGVTENDAAIDEMLAGAFDSKVSAQRVEILLRAILRAGAFELHHHGKVPAGVIINDYVDIAHAFFNAKEPGLVNGVLDKLAKNLRS